MLSSIPNFLGGTTYFVSPNGSDRGTGTIGSPFASINHAVDIAQPGDMIVVRGGTYYGGVEVWQGGSDTAPLTIIAYPGEHPIIDGSGMARNTDLVSITASNVVFNGFEVEFAQRAGISVWSAHNVTILNNVVHDSQTSGINVASDALGVSSGHLVDGNTVYHNVLENAALSWTSGWASGLTVVDTTNSIITDNTVYENYGEGLGALSSQHLTYSGNVAFDNFSAQVYFDNSQYVQAYDNILFETGNTHFYRSGDPGEGMLIANEYTTFQMTSTGYDIHDNTFAGVTPVFYDGSYGWGGGLQNSVLGPETILAAVDVDTNWIPVDVIIY